MNLRYALGIFRISPKGPVELAPADPPPGVIAGIVLGSLAAAILIGGLVFLVQRFYFLQSRVIPDQNHEMNTMRNNTSSRTVADNRNRHEEYRDIATNNRNHIRVPHRLSLTDEDSHDLVSHEGHEHKSDSPEGHQEVTGEEVVSPDDVVISTGQSSNHVQNT